MEVWIIRTRDPWAYGAWGRWSYMERERKGQQKGLED